MSSKHIQLDDLLSWSLSFAYINFSSLKTCTSTTILHDKVKHVYTYCTSKIRYFKWFLLLESLLCGEINDLKLQLQHDYALNLLIAFLKSIISYYS